MMRPQKPKKESFYLRIGKRRRRKKTGLPRRNRYSFSGKSKVSVLFGHEERSSSLFFCKSKQNEPDVYFPHIKHSSSLSERGQPSTIVIPILVKQNVGSFRTLGNIYLSIMEHSQGIKFLQHRHGSAKPPLFPAKRVHLF